MKTIGVFTKDFSLYHDIVKVLKRRRVGYVLLRSQNHIPNRIGVVLTSGAELSLFKGDRAIAVDVIGNVDHALDLALQRITGKEWYARLFVGIDPGDRPGVAVVGDDILLQKDQVDAPEMVVQYVRRALDIYPSKEVVIRVGHGSLYVRNRIVNSLISLKIPIEIVDESNTSFSQFSRFRERDGAAAAAIALLSGGKVQTKLPLEPTRGAIKNIQKRSRALSEGKFTISEKTAIEVLQGKISLQEAILLDKK